MVVNLERLTCTELDGLIDALEGEIDDASRSGDLAKTERLLAVHQRLHTQALRLRWRRLYRKHFRSGGVGLRPAPHLPASPTALGSVGAASVGPIEAGLGAWSARGALYSGFRTEGSGRHR